jgi:hypothetical protein
MRHRSNIAFILLAAALFAAPQVSHDLSTLKGAVAARIRGEILQAFLGLHTNEAGGGAAVGAQQAPRAEVALASCKSDKSEAQPAQAARAKGSERTAQRPEARSQSAMLTDPSDITKSGLPPAAAAELASLPRQILKETRLAMLTPPSNNGVEPPPPPALAFNYTRDERTRTAAAERRKFQELERHAVFIQARFEPGSSEWVRRFADEAARAAEGNAKARTRVLKVRRQGKACGGGDAAVPCVPVAAVTRPDAPVQILIGE